MVRQITTNNQRSLSLTGRQKMIFKLQNTKKLKNPAFLLKQNKKKMWPSFFNYCNIFNLFKSSRLAEKNNYHFSAINVVRRLTVNQTSNVEIWKMKIKTTRRFISSAKVKYESRQIKFRLVWIKTIRMNTWDTLL